MEHFKWKFFSYIQTAANEIVGSVVVSTEKNEESYSNDLNE